MKVVLLFNKLKMLIFKIFKFDSAHKLPNYNGKCSNLHGHTWKLIIGIERDVDDKSGMGIDFGEIKKVVNERVLDRLDHCYLNDIIENPTCENIIFWIKEKLVDIEGLKKITLYETDNNFCELEC